MSRQQFFLFYKKSNFNRFWKSHCKLLILRSKCLATTFFLNNSAFVYMPLVTVWTVPVFIVAVFHFNYICNAFIITFITYCQFFNHITRPLNVFYDLIQLIILNVILFILSEFRKPSKICQNSQNFDAMKIFNFRWL